ncbi:MAG TPA: hypothetical protein VMF61_01780 [Candidatus Acidoferrales bacterium]|nr:hypothetical protein [Candidatus Acidoferrales bacterium]
MAPHTVPAPTSGATISVTGKIVAMIQGGFTIQGPPNVGHLHIYVTPATTLSGPAPAVGETAAASGTGSYNTSMTAATVTVTSGGSSSGGAPIPAQPSALSLTGPIAAVFAGGFTMEGGPNVGLLHVYTNSATTIEGGSPKTGMYAQATGTGSFRTNLTASFVALYPSTPTAVTVTGTAMSATSYGFTATTGGSSPPLPIVMNGSTVVAGASLVTGSKIKVVGIGSPSEGVLAVQIVATTASTPPPTPTPPPISQKHVLTADYLGAPNGTTAVTPQTAASYLSWAQVAPATANSTSAAGIKTQLYADPNRTQANVGDPMYNSNESTFAHDCNNNRVTDTYAGNVTQYVMNIGGSAMQSLFSTYIAGITATAHFDAVYEDDAGPLSEQIYTPFSAMPCNYTDAAWLAAGQAIDQASSVPVLFNGLEAFDGQNVTLSIGLLNSSNTIGGNFEDCYSAPSQPKSNGWVWQETEDTELQVNAQNKLFECQLRDSTAAASSTDARLYGLASFLLTYNPATSILWEEFATPSGLHVEPESQLVLLDPLVPSPAAVSGLAVSGGTYGRQYGQCYYAGSFVGPCAVVVNPDTTSHVFPFPQYNHTLVLSGGGILDGGTVSTTGPPPPTSLAPSEAAIVFP